ncbi:MAG: XAC0095 family protein [Rhodanobacter sp.]
MSEFDSDDLDTTGYFLPEDSQLRLKKLREYVEFLSHLAQPRTADEEQEWTAEIRVGEVAICLELLAEQVGLVLDEISWPAERGERAAAPGANAEPEAAEADPAEPEVAEPVPDQVGGRYLFGVTLDQIDELNLLIDMIRAHGDVVIANDDAEFADHTLSVLGHAIFCDAEKLRDIISDVGSQMLGQARGPQTGVGEERAVYLAGRARLLVGSVSHSAWPLPAYQQRGQVHLQPFESLRGGR